VVERTGQIGQLIFIPFLSSIFLSLLSTISGFNEKFFKSIGAVASYKKYFEVFGNYKKNSISIKIVVIKTTDFCNVENLLLFGDN
jgi:hypothetical protein